MRRSRFLTTIAGAHVAAGLLSASPALAEQPTTDVVHWLTSGAESAAVTVLAKEFEKRGGKWIDSPVPGGGGDAQTLLMSRVAGGNPPAVSYLALGPTATELGTQGVLRDIKDLAAKNGLAKTPPVMIDLATAPGGAVYSLPLAIETQNVMWYSKAVFQKAGLELPKTWAEFLKQAETLKAKGFIPIAVGAQSWQVAILFYSVVEGEGGSDLFDAISRKHDPQAAGSAAMVHVFETLRALSRDSDAGANNRTWNDTLNLVAEDKAAFQIMGSWAGAELRKMNLPYGTKWGCAMSPGNDKAILYGAGFEFPKVTGAADLAGQTLFIEMMMDPKVQAEFSAVKGAVPARLDADTSALSDCDKMSAGVMRDKGAFAALESVVSSDVNGQVEDAVSHFWSDPSVTPEAAAKQLSAILATQK